MITVTVSGNPAEAAVIEAARQDQAASPEEYLQKQVDAMVAQWVTAYSIGTITSGAYVLRFTPAENDAINTAAQTDPTLAGFLDQVRNAPQVELYAEEVIQGHAYLVANGLLTQQRSDEILAY